MNKFTYIHIHDGDIMANITFTTNGKLTAEDLANVIDTEKYVANVARDDEWFVEMVEEIKDDATFNDDGYIVAYSAMGDFGSAELARA